MLLTPEVLLSGYRQGIFPMALGKGRIYWYDPDPRAIFPLEDFHVPRSLARTLRKGIFSVRVDHDFRAIMQACAEPAPGREDTWISAELIDVYTQLHQMGHAHAVEAWIGDQCVGGLYGVTVGGLFAGESMFSRATDASKVALVHLIERLRAGGFVLLDTQFMTPHLARFGAQAIRRAEYKQRLQHALTVEATFFPPNFPPSG
jgi:leucyl/phenylalanyl-tRNA--protein transferase